jgi:para-aminobenzoate synthetase component 1
MYPVNISLGELTQNLLGWSSKFTHFALYLGNNYPDPYHQYDLLFAAGAKRIIKPQQNKLDTLYEGWMAEKSWLFGYIGYDVKNEVERLTSTNQDTVVAPDLYFFEPEIVGYIKDGVLHLETQGNLDAVYREIMAATFAEEGLPKINFSTRLSREAYLEKVHGLQAHIQLGDIYEVNFCQEFYAESVSVTPEQVFAKLNAKAHPPFAAFLNLPEVAVMCASPERYLQKFGVQLTSQPIKGTARRSAVAAEDEKIKTTLATSIKEKAENVMIVDLVRNDLSRVAAKASVQVPELFGVHTFPTVHQLVSTVTATLHENKTWLDALKTSYPMGSMTGAPKVRAMQLIEEFEVHKRGIYSGALGYITPAGDFDFNVVIRSLLCNKTTGYLSLSVGGAITILADTEAEYDECLLKAEALLGLFS